MNLNFCLQCTDTTTHMYTSYTFMYLLHILLTFQACPFVMACDHVFFSLYSYIIAYFLASLNFRCYRSFVYGQMIIIVSCSQSSCFVKYFRRAVACNIYFKFFNGYNKIVRDAVYSQTRYLINKRRQKMSRCHEDQNLK